MTTALHQFEDSKKFSFVLYRYLSTEAATKFCGTLKFVCPRGDTYDRVQYCSCGSQHSQSTENEYPRILSYTFTIDKGCVPSKFDCVFACSYYSRVLEFDAFFAYSIVNRKEKRYIEGSCTKNEISVIEQEFHVSIANFPDINTLKTDLCLEPNDAIEIVCEIRFERKSDCLSNEERKSILRSVKPRKDVLKEDLKTLFENQKCCDVKLITRDNKEIEAHKAILAARSPVFSSMFEHDMREQNENVVEIKDFDYNVLKATLLYMYTGRVDGLEELAGEILPFAEKYNTISLKDYCENVLIKYLATSNAVQILILSDMCNANKLRTATEKFIISESRDVVEREEYKNMKKSHPHLVMEICDMVLKNCNVQWNV